MHVIVHNPDILDQQDAGEPECPPQDIDETGVPVDLDIDEPDAKGRDDQKVIETEAIERGWDPFDRIDAAEYLARAKAITGA